MCALVGYNSVDVPSYETLAEAAFGVAGFRFVAVVRAPSLQPSPRHHHRSPLTPLLPYA
jgi:hypothetical protein